MGKKADKKRKQPDSYSTALTIAFELLKDGEGSEAVSAVKEGRAIDSKPEERAKRLANLARTLMSGNAKRAAGR